MRESRILHVMRVGGAIAAHGAQERENVLINDREHLGRGKILKPGPAQIVVVAAFGIVPFGKNFTLHRFTQTHGFVFFEGMQII